MFSGSDLAELASRLEAAAADHVPRGLRANLVPRPQLWPSHLVNKLNDGMSWGIFPLIFAANGLGVERIGVLKAVYPAVWGLLQIATGPLSDRWGRKGLIVAGMWIQAGALFLTALTLDFAWWLAASPAAGPRHGDGLSEPDRCRLRCFTSVLARAFAQRLPFLARPGLCDRRAVGRHHRRPVWPRLGDRLDRRADVSIGDGCGGIDAGTFAMREGPVPSSRTGKGTLMKAFSILNDPRGLCNALSARAGAPGILKPWSASTLTTSQHTDRAGSRGSDAAAVDKAFGNPSAFTWAGVPAQQIVEAARSQVVDLLGCAPNEIVFTSGGSEAMSRTR